MMNNLEKKGLMLNPKYLIFKDKNDNTKIYSGLNDKFYLIDDKTIKLINDFEESFNSLSSDEIEYLKRTKIVIDEESFNNRNELDLYISQQLNKNLKLLFSPSCSNDVNKVFLYSLCTFCFSKNSHIVDLEFNDFNNSSDIDNSLLIRKTLLQKNFIVYSTYYLDIETVTETNLQKIYYGGLVKIYFKIHESNIERFDEIRKKVELLYYFFKYKSNNRLELSINYYINRNNIDFYKTLLKFVEDTYGRFFNLFYSLDSTKDCCPDIARMKFVRPFEIQDMIYIDDILGTSTRSLLPEPDGYFFCNSQIRNYYVMDLNGNIYKCWHDLIDSKNTLGNILTRNYNVNETSLIKAHSFFNNKCKVCFLEKRCRGFCATYGNEMDSCPKKLYEQIIKNTITNDEVNCEKIII